MSDEFLFVQSAAQNMGSCSASVDLAGAEHFSGIAGTTGSALLVPVRAGLAEARAAGTEQEWYRCRLLTDSRSATPGRATAMMLITFGVPDGQAAEFDAWYEREHIPMLMRADGWLSARRFVVTGRGPRSADWTSVAIHLLASLEVLDSEERRLARSTPWRAQFASLPWFEAAGRFLYRPVLREDDA